MSEQLIADITWIISCFAAGLMVGVPVRLSK